MKVLKSSCEKNTRFILFILGFFEYSFRILHTTFAASFFGYPYTPVDIAGNDILSQPNSSASFRLFLYAFSRSFSSLLFPPYHIGPTVCITYFDFRFPAVVATASPVGNPFGYFVLLISLHSSSILGPPFLCIAPSTPPPP